MEVDTSSLPAQFVLAVRAFANVACDRPAGSGHPNGDAWARLIDDLEELLRNMRLLRGLTPDDADDLRSQVLLQLMTAFIDGPPARLIALEDWLRDLVRREIERYFDPRRNRPRLTFVDGHTLAEIAAAPNVAADPADSDDRRHNGHSPRHGQADAMLRGFDAVRRKVSQSSWNLFIDVAVNDLPLKAAARQHGKSYDAARKTIKRIRTMILAQTSQADRT
jgi:hypothetical protein